MEMNVYAIRDIHTGYMSPMLDMNDEAAKRNFAYTINNNPGVIGFRPADFDLYGLGVFNSDSGVFTNYPVPEFIVNGASVIGDVK